MMLLALASLGCDNNYQVPEPEPIRPPPEPPMPRLLEKVEPAEPGIPLSKHVTGRKHLSRKQRKNSNGSQKAKR
jgi:hypothetical protein